MKKYILIMMAGFFFLTSCKKDNDELRPLGEEVFEQGDGFDDWDNSASNNGGDGELSLYKISGNNIELIKDYQVSSNLKSFQEDKGKHQKMWDFTTELIPLEYRNKIAEFEVFHGDGGLLGYVLPLNDNDLSKWRFALAIDAAENLNTINLSDLFTFVTIHEYGHVLTLNDEQINVGGSENSCNNYFTGEGCSTSTSYINELFEIGWKDIINEHDQDNADATYNKYKDRFVSDYAATNPGEDIAEVFSFFVINNNPPVGNSIAEQKIKLLYQYPELTQLRDRIRANGMAAKMDASKASSALKGFRICGKKGCGHRQN